MTRHATSKRVRRLGPHPPPDLPPSRGEEAGSNVTLSGPLPLDGGGSGWGCPTGRGRVPTNNWLRSFIFFIGPMESITSRPPFTRPCRIARSAVFSGHGTVTHGLTGPLAKLIVQREIAGDSAEKPDPFGRGGLSAARRRHAGGGNRRYKIAQDNS